MGYYGRGDGNRIGNATHETTVAAWVNRSGDVRGSRMFCEGATIYSYGYHFAIATHLDDAGDGIRRALFTVDKYSSTTSGHCSHVRCVANRVGIALLRSVSMTPHHSARAEDALAFVRRALDTLETHKRSADIGFADVAERDLATAREHAELYGESIQFFDKLAAEVEAGAEQFRLRAGEIFGQRTARAFVDLFALHGVTGELISAGAYMTPDFEGKLERRLCAYWRASDGRFVRITKGWPSFDCVFLDTLPADLAAGV